MVVVLIIGILLAIAIPTYLGVTNNAKDKAAESNLQTVLTGEIANETQYSNFLAYGTGTTPGAQATILDNVPLETALVTTGTLNSAVEVNTSSTALCLSAYSGSGNYYGIYSDTNGNTLYAKETGSSAKDPCTGTMTTAPTAGSAGWARTTSGASW